MQTIRILQREIILGMRLLGVTNVQQLTPQLVSMRYLDFSVLSDFGAGRASRLAAIAGQDVNDYTRSTEHTYIDCSH